MKECFVSLFMACLFIMPSYAATETLEFYFLPVHEASEIVKTQLSADGNVVEIPSKRMLLVHDTYPHIQKAKSLLRKLDKPATQLVVQVRIEDVADLDQQFIAVEGRLSPLSGGWVQLAIEGNSRHVSIRNQYQLRVLEQKLGRIEVGEVHAFNQVTRRWLSGYGIVEEGSAVLLPVTSGFDVQADLVGGGLVHIRITPWLQQVHGHENKNHAVRIAGAATELTIKLDQEVTIAAAHQEAKMLGSMLLGEHAQISKRQLLMHLKVSR